ncbi:MAG: DKNYY domain-containing protein [Lentisphaeria bacterium]|nr:DKNYY domain-containing protein [Lentisphaeria bacterium]
MRLFQYLTLVVALSLVSCAVEVAAEEDLGQGYSHEGKYILFEGKRIDQEGKRDIDHFSKAVGRQLTLCSEVDAASFQVLSEEYTKDKDKVYYKWISPGRFWVVELPEADATSFEVLGFNLARDKKNVWWYGKVQSGVDAATVELVRDGFVWKDVQSVWYQHNTIVGADARTFLHIGSGYYMDKTNVYWGPDPIEGADLATFKVLGDSFVAVDRNMVYRSGERLPQMDPGTCKFILHDPYGYQVISDNNGVYLNKLKFLHAVPNNFKMIDNLTGRGGKYMFLIDTYHSTPVTVYWEEGQLVTETVLYERRTAKPLAIVKAEVSGDKLENITFSPPPGQVADNEIPDWQVKVFKRADLVKRMKAAGELLK